MRPATVPFSRRPSTPAVEWPEPAQAEVVLTHGASEIDQATEEHAVKSDANISCQHETQFDPGGSKSTECEGRSLSTSSQQLEDGSLSQGNMEKVEHSSASSVLKSEQAADQRQQMNHLPNSVMAATSSGQ
jgi:hypothetical protein